MLRTPTFRTAVWLAAAYLLAPGVAGAQQGPSSLWREYPLEAEQTQTIDLSEVAEADSRDRSGNVAPTRADTPTTGADTPATGADTPATGADTPATGADTPATGADTPPTGADRSTAGGGEMPGAMSSSSQLLRLVMLTLALLALAVISVVAVPALVGGARTRMNRHAIHRPLRGDIRTERRRRPEPQDPTFRARVRAARRAQRRRTVASVPDTLGPSDGGEGDEFVAASSPVFGWRDDGPPAPQRRIRKTHDELVDDARRSSAPSASSLETPRRRMQATPRRDTKPELALRRELHRLGLRYFVHRRPISGLRREADLVFPRSQVAVFVDSCFWHGCREHITWPKANADSWRAKIERTIERDRETDALLDQSGWVPVRVWEHDDASAAALRIRELVLARRR